MRALDEDWQLVGLDDAYDIGELLKVVGTLTLQASISLGDNVLSKPSIVMQLAGQRLQDVGQAEPVDTDLDKIATSLQRLCMWDLKTQGVASHFDLSLLVTGKHTDDKQRRARKQVRQNLKACGIDLMNHSKQNVKHKHFLTHFMEELDSLAQIDIDTKKKRARQTPVDYPGHVNTTLHKFLKRKSKCSCNRPHQKCDLRKAHRSRLRLTNGVLLRDEHIVFDTLFSADGVLNTSSNINHWQQIRILVPSKSNQAKRARFADDVQPPEDNKSAATPEIHPPWFHKWKKVKNLCEVINDHIGPVHRCLKIDGNEAFLLHKPEPGSQELKADESVPLGEVLRQDRLTPKMKIILAYILAYSTWQFYSSDWTSTLWSIESIHFMKERGSRDTIRINVTKPCLTIRFDHDDASKVTEYHDIDVLHHYPRVLTLGELLVDIGLHSVSVPPSCCTYRNRAERINVQWSQADRARKDKYWPYFETLRGGAIETYRNVTEACFNSDMFELQSQKSKNQQAGQNEHEKAEALLQQQIEERRGILYEQVVYPLEELVRDSNWLEDLGKLECVTLDQCSEPRIENHANRARAETTAFDPNARDKNQAKLLGVTSDQEGKKMPGAHTWMTSLRALHQSFIRANPSTLSSKTRIKIAVLDTGYDPKSDFCLDNQRAKRIPKSGWKDFAEQARKGVDEDGHGTHVLSVLMKCAPLADIYIARVAKGTDDLEESSEAIAEAIKTAANEWKVDIISMSFGFPYDSHSEKTMLVSKAIDQAAIDRDNNILFFAAAGNEGANQRTMFPANHVKVIPVFGTNSAGEFQRSMNPPLLHDDPSVFGTLAVDVPCADRAGKADIDKSGTSFATPVAAGTAAMILEHARVLEEKDPSRKGNKSQALRSKPRMLSMLRGVCKGQQIDGRRYYLDPRVFFTLDEEARWSMIVVALI